MSVKSQQDIKNANRDKREKIPKSMENKNFPSDQPNAQENPQPIVPLITRVSEIEKYLLNVDLAFSKIVDEIENLKSLIKIVQIMDSEISRLTGDMVRLTKLQEDRYLELVNGINAANTKIETLDEYVPIFIDKRISDYFEDPIQETPPEST